jgi:hypothetical protein
MNIKVRRHDLCTAKEHYHDLDDLESRSEVRCLRSALKLKSPFCVNDGKPSKVGWLRVD